MNLNVSEVLAKKTTVKNFNIVLKEEDLFKTVNEIRLNKPFVLEGQVTLVGDNLHLDGEMKGELLLSCSRCTERFAYEVNMEIHEEFTHNTDNKDDNIIFIESDSLDITEIIENNILLAMPIKRLCSDNCKGLCQKCGTNLNISTCNCDNEQVDPRLSALKNFFSAE
jgi:uncharacterized protein